VGTKSPPAGLKALFLIGALRVVGNAIVTPTRKLTPDRPRDPRISLFAQRLAALTNGSTPAP